MTDPRGAEIRDQTFGHHTTPREARACRTHSECSVMLGWFAQHAVAFLREEDGATAVEYAVMLALIIAVVITVSNIGGTTNSSYSNPALQKAVQPGGS